MENKKGISKGVIITSIIIVLLVVAIVVGAFYIHNSKPVNVEEDTLPGGDIALTYSDEENLFVIENALPTSDVVGTTLDSAELFFDFTVKTEIEDAEYIEYEILLVKDETLSTALNDNVKVYLEREKSGTFSKVNDPVLFSANVKDAELGDSVMKVHNQRKTSSGSDNYRLRLWISDTAVFTPGEIQNFGVKVAIKGTAK